MVKNKGGNKTKGKSRKSFRIKELGLKDLKKDEGQEYAFVRSVYGDGRYELMCYDKKKRLGILRGSLKRKTRISKSDLVLVSLRNFQDDKCDIVAVYTQLDKDKLVKGKAIYYSFSNSGELIPDKTDDLGGEDIAPPDSDDEGDIYKQEPNVRDKLESPINPTGLNIEDI
jgi:translation initiation factor 1A